MKRFIGAHHGEYQAAKQQGRLMIWVSDLWQCSSTAGVKRKMIFRVERPMQLYTPPGVAHGYKVGLEGGAVLYAMDQQFNLADPYLGRLAWELFGSGLWLVNRS